MEYPVVPENEDYQGGEMIFLHKAGFFYSVLWERPGCGARIPAKADDNRRSSADGFAVYEADERGEMTRQKSRPSKV